MICPASPEGEYPDLSIVIASWNTRDILANCLASIRHCAGTEAYEVIVVDNASSDGSPEMVVREFPEVELIRNRENRGFAAANNQAIRVARGRHVLLLNSDTFVLGNVLQETVAYLDRHPDVGAFGCRVLNTDGTVQKTCFQYPTLVNLLLKATGLWRLDRPRFFGREHMRHWSRDTERDVDVITGCYLAVRREIIERVGMLDDTFFFCGEETDWCRRIRDAGWRVRFAPVGEIVHLGGASGKKQDFRRDLHLTQGLVRYHRKHSGAVVALLAYLLLYGFNASRWGYWGLRARLIGRERDRDRHTHFRNIVDHYRDAWPLAASPSPVCQ